MTFANKITLLRIISIPFFVGTLVFYTPERGALRAWALGIFLFAVVSDMVDGAIARARREKTRAGTLLDPLADKILLITAFILVYHVSAAHWRVPLPLWVVIAVVSRDLIVLMGSAVILMTHKDITIEPTRWGKGTTFFQMATITAVILESRLSPIIWDIAAVFTFISGVDYIRRGINLLNQYHPETPHA
jgi:cardiolipin synthase